MDGLHGDGTRSNGYKEYLNGSRREGRARRMWDCELRNRRQLRHRWGISEPLLKRYRDELEFHSGITHIIIYEGTNDIGTSNSEPAVLAHKLTEAYKEIISYAHSKGIKVFIATITPTKGNGWYSPSHEQTRQEVNRWIRKGEGFEGIIDFDRLVRDPQDEEKLKAEYSEDWLHLNPEGYEAMGRYAARIIANDIGQAPSMH